MTTDELAALCVGQRRLYKEHGFKGEPGLVLSIPRIATGERMRVMPGVMGEVLSWNGKETNVRVLVRDIEKALTKMGGGK